MQSTEEEKVMRTCLISSIGLEPTKAHFHGLIELHGPSWILLGGPKVDIIDFLMITQVFPSTVQFSHNFLIRALVSALRK